VRAGLVHILDETQNARIAELVDEAGGKSNIPLSLSINSAILNVVFKLTDYCCFSLST